MSKTQRKPKYTSADYAELDKFLTQSEYNTQSEYKIIRHVKKNEDSENEFNKGMYFLRKNQLSDAYNNFDKVKEGKYYVLANCHIAYIFVKFNDITAAVKRLDTLKLYVKNLPSPNTYDIQNIERLELNLKKFEQQMPLTKPSEATVDEYYKGKFNDGMKLFQQGNLSGAYTVFSQIKKDSQYYQSSKDYISYITSYIASRLKSDKTKNSATPESKLEREKEVMTDEDFKILFFNGMKLYQEGNLSDAHDSFLQIKSGSKYHVLSEYYISCIKLGLRLDKPTNPINPIKVVKKPAKKLKQTAKDDHFKAELDSGIKLLEENNLIDAYVIFSQIEKSSQYYDSARGFMSYIAFRLKAADKAKNSETSEMMGQVKDTMVSEDLSQKKPETENDLDDIFSVFENENNEDFLFGLIPPPPGDEI